LIDQLYSLVNEGAKRLGNWPVIFADQNIPRPVKPYITVKATNVDIPDHVIYTPLNENDEQTVIGWRKASVEVQVYNGIESLSSVNTLALVLQTNKLLEYQNSIDCAIGQRLFIGYVPEILNTLQYEGRGIYQFEFLYTESYTDQEYSICSVELHGRYIGGASNPDAGSVFDPPPFPPGSLICNEIIPCWEELDTNWDNSETTWDKTATHWDRELP